VPASVQNPRSHFVNARTARSRQAVCRGPLIRLPDAAIGVPLLRAAAQAARSSRPMLCASVCMVVTPGGLAVKLLAASTNLSSNPPRLPRGPCQHPVGVVGRSVGEAQVTAARATGLQRGGLGCGTRPAEGERQALLRVETRVRVIRILYLPLTRGWLQSGVSSKESSGASGS
jgi:hypothetical protein